ncbi:MAG: bifunctional phosphoribosylaminoimidazolecarboxamide formyltransferase/IMP cyclohydrolase PurH [Bacteroidetes bacterium]|nr:MAG: bifunctional phosphoribosylaminoimidazolecarboxamide formyltransferase/IMP cyclohydrolase PurH [Bacteroidota bacterium]
MDEIKIKSALISVFDKQGIDEIVFRLRDLGVKIYSTGGTQKYIEQLGVNVTAVEDITSYPSVFGGRVKTLHPKIFGGILKRREHETDVLEAEQHQIPNIDLVIVDLYPFEETVKNGGSEEEIIEKIDIGGISLIRAAAKNFKDVLIIPSKEQYSDLLKILNEQNGTTNLEQRKKLAKEAFKISSHYDTAIYRYFSDNPFEAFKESILESKTLRYGENPHQKGVFFGNWNEWIEQLNGKEISYNNLLDIDAALLLMEEFKNEEPTVAILKHNNACGLSTRSTLLEAWTAALAGDPVSAFGGVIISNTAIDILTAQEIHKLFFEVLIAPDFMPDALELLSSKKNRILLKSKHIQLPKYSFKSALNGVLFQERDAKTENETDLKPVTHKQPSEAEIKDLIFANKIVKHTKSNAIVLAKNRQLIASGTGQTSRVDALEQAIKKAEHFGFDLSGAVMASDAFFPFPDCVEIASKKGIRAVIQPGGSIKDQESIDYCNKHNIAMVFTGIRHFKH